MQYTILTILAAALLMGCAANEESKKGNQPETIVPAKLVVKEIVGIGKIEPENEIINLAATSGGIVREVFKNDGSEVKEGDILLKLDDDLEQIRIEQVKSQMKTQQLQIESDLISIKDTELKIANKKKLLLSTQALVKKGAETTQILDDLETEVSSLGISIEKGKSAVSLSQSRLNELQQQLNLLQSEANKKVLRSPYQGIILDMQAKKGSAISQFQNYAEFAPKGKNIIRAEVDEMFCDQLKIGQAVQVRLVGSDKNIATGEIIMLSPYLKRKSLFSEKASDQEDRRVREIKININGDAELIINTKVECVIIK